MLLSNIRVVADVGLTEMLADVRLKSALVSPSGAKL
jgi:hypothetical protein